MIRKVLKAFPFAADHIRSTDLSPGQEVDFPDDIIPGLVAEGFIEAEAKAAELNAQPGSGEQVAAEGAAAVEGVAAGPATGSAGGYTARHKAGGFYEIVDAAGTVVPVAEKMRKDAAEAKAAELNAA